MSSGNDLYLSIKKLTMSVDFLRYRQHLEEELAKQDRENRVTEGVQLHRGQGKARFIADQLALFDGVDDVLNRIRKNQR